MELLVGEHVMQKTAEVRVIIFGVGGVQLVCRKPCALGHPPSHHR